MKQHFDITILSDSNSWINSFIPIMINQLEQAGHKTVWVHHPENIQTGDFTFCLGCGQLVSASVLKRSQHTLVVHASDLPKGRGWSPVTWHILEGKRTIPITLFEAQEAVDSGKIYLQKEMQFEGTELIDEIRISQANASVALCLDFVRNYPEILLSSREQQGEPSYYPRRGPLDSQLDPDKTIREQFNLLRVVDNNRYPAFFHLEDETYLLKIEKYSENALTESFASKQHSS